MQSGRRRKGRPNEMKGLEESNQSKYGTAANTGAKFGNYQLVCLVLFHITPILSCHVLCRKPSGYERHICFLGTVRSRDTSTWAVLGKGSLAPLSPSPRELESESRATSCTLRVPFIIPKVHVDGSAKYRWQANDRCLPLS